MRKILSTFIPIAVVMFYFSAYSSVELNKNKSITIRETKPKSKFQTKSIPVPFLLKNGKKILVDSKTFAPISNKQYEDLRLFNDGLARAKQNGKWGFIDLKENVTIPFIYDLAFDFNNGIAWVSHGSNKNGFINTLGKIVIPLEFSGFRSDNTEMKLGHKLNNSTKKNNWYLINLIDYKVIPVLNAMEPSEGLMGVKKNDKWGFIDRNGEIKINFIYEEVFPFSEELARVKLNGQWIIIDKTGKEIIKSVGITNYLDYDFHDGLLAVKKNEKWGFIDKYGTEIVEFKFDNVNNFNNGFASVRVKNKWGVIDKKGNFIIPLELEYYNVGKYSEGLISVCDRNLKWGFIDLNGNPISDMIYESAYEFKNGFATVSKSIKNPDGTGYNGYGLINNKGEVIIPCIYRNLFIVNQFVELEQDSDNSTFFSSFNGKLYRK